MDPVGIERVANVPFGRPGGALRMGVIDPDDLERGYEGAQRPAQRDVRRIVHAIPCRVRGDVCDGHGELHVPATPDQQPAAFARPFDAGVPDERRAQLGSHNHLAPS